MRPGQVGIIDTFLREHAGARKRRADTANRLEKTPVPAARLFPQRKHHHKSCLTRLKFVAVYGEFREG